MQKDNLFLDKRQELIVEVSRGRITAMRIPLTRYGLPQVAFYPAVIVVMMAMGLVVLSKASGSPAAIAVWAAEVILLVVLIWALSFFRDPERVVPQESNLLISPADGTVTDVDILDGCEYIEGKVMRIGIFLSVFNVHINRAPCKARVETIQYKQGKFKDARDKTSSKVNESNDVAMVRLEEPKDKLVVRQISGAIARRIVCEAKKGGTLKAGERFGMIKFGSRTELYLPARANAKCLVKPGDAVHAGQDVLVRYE
jgi:phosphatidylserine decarboxylase